MVNRIFVHEDWTNDDGEGSGQNDDFNDIALLRLVRPVNLFHYPPACLPENSTSAIGLQATVAGWGNTPASLSNWRKHASTPARQHASTPVRQHASNWRKHARVIKQTTVEVISNTECDDHPNTHSQHAADELCAKTPEGSSIKTDACSGDSGGPLTVDLEENGVQTLIGVVSSGEGECRQVSIFIFFLSSYLPG